MKKSVVWYKSSWLWVFVIGLPLLVMVACICFVIYAIKIQDSTVRDDWYMDGKALYQDASKDQLAYDLGVAGIMRFEGDQVSFDLNYPSHTKPDDLRYPKTLAVSISHATNKNNDRDFILTHTQDNHYTAKVSLDPLPAKYYLQINAPKEFGWRLIHAQKLPAHNVAFVPLKAFAPS